MAEIIEYRIPMNQRFFLVLFAAGCLALMTGAGIEPDQTGLVQQTPEGSAIRFLDGGTPISVDISLFDNIIYLPCRVAGAASLDFVLDTGATDNSAIDEQVAEDLGLEPGRTMMGGGAGPERVPMRELGGIRLFLPGMELTGFRFMTIPLKRMEPYWGRKKDGLLGGNILGRLVTQIDYDRNKVTFHDPRSFEASGKGMVIPLIVQSNSLFVKAKVISEASNFPKEGLFLLDTGVRTTFFNTPFTARNELIRNARRTIENIAGYGIGGVVRGIMGRVASIRIGDLEIQRPVVEFSTDTEGIAGSDRFDGIIGADILSRFHVTFDYQKQVMILQKGAGFPQPFEYDMSGLYFISTGETNNVFTVENVVEDSPAAKAGAAKGDLLISVNDLPASSFTLETLKRYLRQDGRPVTLRINRAGKVVELSFRLERLI